MSQWLSHISQRSRLLKGILVLAGGAALAQTIVFVISPVLTRMYSPADFGVLGVYTSFFSLALVIASFRYDLAVPLPDDDRTATLLVVLSLLMTGVSSLVLLCIIFWVGDHVDLPIMKRHLLLLPLTLAGAGVYQVLNAWAVRRKEFAAVARTRVSQSMGKVLVQVGLGAVAVGPVGLILGETVGYVGGTWVLAKLVWRNSRQHVLNMSCGELAKVAVRYRRFPLVSTWSALLNVGALQLPALLFASQFGAESAGSFSFSQRIIAAPMAVVGMAVGQVYVAEAARLSSHDPGAAFRLFQNSAKKLFLVGVVPIGLLGVAAPFLFPLLFGPQWTEAGMFVQVLAPAFLGQFVVSPLSQTLNILERQDLQFIGDLVRFVTTLVGFAIVGQVGGSALNATSVYSVVLFGTYGMFFWLNWFSLKRSASRSRAVAK